MHQFAKCGRWIKAENNFFIFYFKRSRLLSVFFFVEREKWKRQEYRKES